MRSVAVLAILATPVQAQDLIDTDVILGCLDNLPDSPSVCVGAAASHCDLMQGAGMQACIAAETDLWEQWRERAQQDLLAAAQARENDNPTIEQGSLTEALAIAESAWLSYRTALCAHAALAFDDAASDDDEAACQLQITADKTFDLRRLETLYQTR